MDLIFIGDRRQQEYFSSWSSRPEFRTLVRAEGSACAVGVLVDALNAGNFAYQAISGTNSDHTYNLPAEVALAIAENSNALRSMLLSGVMSGDIVRNVIADVEDFYSSQVLTRGIARELGLTFPPGHPIPETMYKQHPLAVLKGSGKEGVYVPLADFDELLLEERHSELKRILIALGATRIRSHRARATHRHSSQSNMVEVFASVYGATSLNSKSSNGSADSFSCRDELVLDGKQWTEGDRLDRSAFGWLQFEPHWHTIVDAREQGGCSKATLEIATFNQFSAESDIAASIRVKLVSISGRSSEVRNQQDDESVFIDVDFGNYGKPGE